MLHNNNCLLLICSVNFFVNISVIFLWNVFNAGLLLIREHVHSVMLLLLLKRFKYFFHQWESEKIFYFCHIRVYQPFKMDSAYNIAFFLNPIGSWNYLRWWKCFRRLRAQRATDNTLKSIKNALVSVGKTNQISMPLKYSLTVSLCLQNPGNTLPLKSNKCGLYHKSHGSHSPRVI